jgi:hypothetical protein
VTHDETTARPASQRFDVPQERNDRLREMEWMLRVSAG